MRSQKLLKSQKKINFCFPLLFSFVLMCLIVPPQEGHCRPNLWTYGVSIGLGGTGMKTSAEVDGIDTNVERAEGPGTISIYADRIYSDYWTLSLEHIRGFRFGPLSSGLSFTGIGGKWYFWSPIPSFPELSPESTQFFVQQFSPYLGAMVGAASGSIYRGNDKVTAISGSGMYFGLRGGMDYLLQPGFGLRGETSLSTTLSYSEKPQTTLTEFSIRIGFLLFY